MIVKTQIIVEMVYVVWLIMISIIINVKVN